MHNPGCGACHDPETMEHLHRLMEGWGREEQERYKLTVGELLDSINQILNLNVTAEDLVKVAEIGQLLFYEAVCTADEQDNVEFLAAAYGFYDPLVDTVLEECGREHRDTLTGAARVSR